jgi:hypothetical protein
MSRWLNLTWRAPVHCVSFSACLADERPQRAAAGGMEAAVGGGCEMSLLLSVGDYAASNYERPPVMWTAHYGGSPRCESPPESTNNLTWRAPAPTRRRSMVRRSH